MLEVTDYTSEYLNDVIHAFDVTWGWELKGIPEEKLALATFYVTHALSVSNIRRVALVDGDFAGLMFGSIPTVANPYTDNATLLRLMEQAFETLKKTHTGREAIAMYASIDTVNAKLMAQMKQKRLTWQASMNLLISMPDFIGKGAGALLVKSYFQTLKEADVEHVILYTDDHCNYRYYDTHGWERAAEEDWTLDNEPIHAIAYRKEVS